MKKLSFLVALAVITGSAQAASLYDDFTGVTSGTTSASTPGFLFGDGATSIASPGDGNAWRITSVDLGVFYLGAQSYAANQIQARITLYGGFNNTSTSVMSNQLGTINYNFGAVTTTSNAISLVTGGTLANPISVPSSVTTLGWTVTFYDLVNNVRLSTVRPAFTTTTVPTVGTSPNGFYRDVNDNGIIESNEGFFFNAANASDNMIFRINGTAAPVPEPATLAALGLGAVTVLRRRKKA